MTLNETQILVPGEALALFTQLQELEPGLYLLNSVAEGWAVVSWVIDDEESEKVIITDQNYRIPASLLELFAPIGLRLTFVH